MSPTTLRALATPALLFLCALPGTAAAQVELGAIESFDSLAASGSSAILPTGWHLAESDTNANGEYVADSGGTNSGNTYSYGTGGSTERALGMLQSGSLVPVIGAQVRNGSGSTLSSLLVHYTGEQWRLGAEVRADRLDFQYSTDAASLTTGTWLDVDALDFSSVVTAGPLGALDGNAVANRLAVEATITGLSLPPDAVLWVRWIDQDISGAEDGLAIDDVVFGEAVDEPPVLVSSTPVALGAHPANVSLSLTFSEAVDVAPGAVVLHCGADLLLPVAVEVSGGPVSFAVTPQQALVPGHLCAIALGQVVAITDRDGTPDAMQPESFTFFVDAPVVNAAPEVVSTVPADGATHFPSAGDLSVTFSEPVDIANGAFSLECVASTGIVLSYPASGTTIGIDTGTALVHGDSCSFSIDPALVTDAEGAALVAFGPVAFTVAPDATTGYYDQVNDSSPGQLRCTLHQTIRGHTRYPYTVSGTEVTDTWTILNLADEDPTDSGKILDVYRNAIYDKITGGTGVYNREHTWPNTYGFSGGDPGPYTDTHMLYLTDTGYNSDRGSKPFADCDSGCTEKPTVANYGAGGSGGGDSNWVIGGSGENNGSFEVWNQRKGDMARAVMYMAIRYEGGTHPAGGAEPDLELTDNRSLITSAGSGGKHYMGLLSHLVAWHMADPPDARELARNEVVYSFQNNRNPFVDHAEWGTLALFQSSQPATCEPATGNQAPVAVDDSYATDRDVALVVDAAAGVLANDSDADEDALTAALLANASHGLVVLATDGSFTYTAQAGFCGADSFTYGASDGTASSAAALVALEVACTGSESPIFADGFEEQD